MNCLIVDDNKIARTILRQLSGQVKDLVVVADCDNAMDAYNTLQEQPVDLLLLDIEMPGMTGLELVQNIRHQQPVIVFTTSKKEYAAEAFELNVADYIVKPVTPARFIQAIDKARHIIETRNNDVDVVDENFLFIRDGSVIKKIKTDDILYAEAMGDYVKFYTTPKTYTIHTTLKKVEERLPTNRFIRVHRSYIIALQKIDSIQEGVIQIDGKPIPVADAYRAALNKRMNIL